MTAVVVGEVGEVRVGVTSDGRVWALGRSFLPADAVQLALFFAEAADLAVAPASSGDSAEDAGAEDGRFL